MRDKLVTKEENKFILTIAIPTYNRADYLKRCLLSIMQQLASTANICVKIFDNCSTDETEAVAESFIKMDKRFNYIKNDFNIGPDLNIGQCYYTSNSKYTLVFGDDDVFLDGALDYLINILNTEVELGFIFLNYYHFKNDLLKERPILKGCLDKAYSLDGTSIIRIAGNRIGFISACVVNSKAIDKDELINNANTNFNHLFPILKSVKLGYPNIYVGKYIIAQQDGNSGGFDYFKTFADNFYKIVIQLLGSQDQSVKWIETELIIKVLPTAIIFARNGRHGKSYRLSSIGIIQENFRPNIKFWIFNYPLIKLPYGIASLLRIPIVIGVKLYLKAKYSLFLLNKRSF